MCPTDHYRIHYKHYHYDINEDQTKLDSDYSDAGHFCIRRFFDFGYSDVILYNKGAYSVTFRKETKRIFTDDEVRDLVKRYSNKNLSVML